MPTAGNISAHVAAADLAAHSSFYDTLFQQRHTFPADMADLRQLRVGIASSQAHLALMMRALYSREITLQVSPGICRRPGPTGALPQLPSAAPAQHVRSPCSSARTCPASPWAACFRGWRSLDWPRRGSSRTGWAAQASNVESILRTAHCLVMPVLVLAAERYIEERIVPLAPVEVCHATRRAALD